MKNLRNFDTKSIYESNRLDLPFPCVSTIDQGNLVKFQSPNYILCRYRIDYEDMPYNNRALLFNKIMTKEYGIKAYSVNGDDWVTFEEVRDEEINKTVKFSPQLIGTNDYRYLPDIQYAIMSGEFDNTITISANISDLSEDTSLLIVAYNNDEIEYYRTFNFGEDWDEISSQYLVGIGNGSYSLHENLIAELNSEEYVSREFKMSFCFVNKDFDNRNLDGDKDNIINTNVSFIKTLGGLPSIVVKTDDIKKGQHKYVNVKYRFYEGCELIYLDKICNRYLETLDTKKISEWMRLFVSSRDELIYNTHMMKLKNLIIGKNIDATTAVLLILGGGNHLEKIQVLYGNPYFDSRNNCNAIIDTENNSLVLGCKNTVIPDSVIGISLAAFATCNELETIIIPNSVTSIMMYAFAFCDNLTEISIPDSVELIGDLCFVECKDLTNIHIGSGLKECMINDNQDIGFEIISLRNTVFVGCNGIEYITISEDNPYYNSKNNCNAIIETETNTLILGSSNTVIPSDVLYLSKDSFNNRKLFEIEIPDSITDLNYAFSNSTALEHISFGNGIIGLGDGEFKNAPLREVYITENIIDIDSFAFNRTYLEEIIVSENNSMYDSRENCNAIIKTNKNALFIGCKNTIIPSDIRVIGDNAFRYCKSLESIRIPSNIEYIYWDAFADCSNLCEIICEGEIPPSIFGEGNGWYTRCFDGIANEGVIYCPEGSDYSEWLKYLPEGWETSQLEFVTLYYNVTSTTYSTVLSHETAFLKNVDKMWVDGKQLVKCVSSYQFTTLGLHQVKCSLIDKTIIHNSSFYSSNDLIYIELGKSIRTLEANAFFGSSLLAIKCDAEIVPETFINTFAGTRYNGMLYVPQNSDYSTWLNAPTSDGGIGKNWHIASKYDGQYDLLCTYNVTDMSKITKLFDIQNYDNETNIINAYINDVEIPYQGELFFIKPGIYEVKIKLKDNTIITENLFSGCECLESIDILDSVTQIGLKSFMDCTNLKTLKVGSNVNTIYVNAFNGCDIENIFVSENNAKYDNRENCNGIINSNKNQLIFGWSNTVIPNSVTSIGDYAFYGNNKLSNVIIPDSIITIEDYAFYLCKNISSITIGSSVNSLSFNKFYGSIDKLNTVVVSENNPYYDSRENCNAIIETSTNTLIISSECTIIPSTVTSIGSSAFSGRDSLTEIVIPDTVTNIGYAAFSACDGLISVKIGNGVTTIGNRAFSGCSYLETVIIGDSVTSIGQFAFNNCYCLSEIIIPDSVTSIDKSAFASCRGLKEIVIPNSVKSIGKYVFEYCTGLTSITIGDSVTSIGEQTFLYCKSLTSITIPDSVTSIGTSAFDGCSGLTEITCNAVTAPSIDYGTFYNVPKNGTLYYPQGSDYSSWMNTELYYLGYYNWTSQEIELPTE